MNKLIKVILIFLLINCTMKYVVDPIEIIPLLDYPDWFLNPPENSNYMFASASATSTDIRIAIDRAKIDARVDLAEQIKSNIQGTIENFSKEIEETGDSKFIQSYKKLGSNIVDQTLIGSRVKKSLIVKEGKMYRAFVLMELPLLKKGLMNQFIVIEKDKEKKPPVFTMEKMLISTFALVIILCANNVISTPKFKW